MIREAFEDILRKYGVAAAYAFGSNRDAGRAFLAEEHSAFEEGSDLDLGVIFERLPEQPFTIYGELYAGLATLFGPFALDLVFLQETGPLFQYEAIRGERLFCGNERLIDDYEELVLKLASDLAFKKPEFERDCLEAIRDGYFEITRR